MLGKLVQMLLLLRLFHTLKEYKEFTDQMERVPVLATITEFGVAPMFTTERISFCLELQKWFSLSHYLHLYNE